MSFILLYFYFKVECNAFIFHTTWSNKNLYIFVDVKLILEKYAHFRVLISNSWYSRADSLIFRWFFSALENLCSCVGVGNVFSRPKNKIPGIPIQRKSLKWRGFSGILRWSIPDCPQRNHYSSVGDTTEKTEKNRSDDEIKNGFFRNCRNLL